ARAAEHLGVVDLGGEIHPRGARRLVDRSDHGDDLEGDAPDGRDRERVREAGRVTAHQGGVAERVEQPGDRGAHGEHAVGDDAGQPGLGRDGVVVVDGVEVPGGAGVSHEGVAADLVAGAGELLADGQGGEVDGGGGG